MGVMGRLGKCGRGFLRGREGELDGTWVLTDGDMFWYLRTFKPAWLLLSLTLKRLCAWNIIPTYPNLITGESAHDPLRQAILRSLCRLSLPGQGVLGQ